MFSKNISVVGLGQMQDVFFGQGDSIPDSETILAMYEHKTAMYTFSLPMMLGALLSAKSEQTIDQLERFGALAGRLFQIRDDYLGLYASGNAVGKSTGIDFLSGKKTVFYSLLSSRCNADDLKNIQKLQDKKSLDGDDIDFIRDLISKYDILSTIRSIERELHDNARTLLDRMELEETEKDFLSGLLTYVVERNS